MSGPAGDVDAALAGARRFLAARGAPREARFVAALAGELDPAALAREAGAGQDRRGALAPLLAGDAQGPGVASTHDALEWLVGLGLSEGPVVDRAAGYLVGAQEADGGWSDPVADGDEGRLALGAGICGLLVRCPAARVSALRRAGEYLAAHWSRERVQRGSYPAIAGYLHAFAGLPAELDVADEALQWCGRELERGFRSGAFDPVAVGRVFVLCHATAIPGARLGAAEVVAALLRGQAPDGGFGEGGGRERASCGAALALAHLRSALR
jgi:hypothetical protein